MSADKFEGQMYMGLTEIGDGRLFKMAVNYAEQVDSAIPKAEKLTKAGKLVEGLESLCVLEKQTRLGADMRSNGRIVRGLVRLCFEAKNWILLNETIITLSKKRSLIKQAITEMVQDCCQFVDETPSKEIQFKLIDTLRTVTDGKIYVEVERARLTLRLVKALEKEKKVEEACKMLLELQVETYGSMEMKEKVEILLEQVRLCIARKDFIRAFIISNKISTKFFTDTENEIQQLKLSFYRMMIEIDGEKANYLAICRHYWAVYDTPLVQNDRAKLEESLKNAVLFVLLASHNNEQWDLLHRIKVLRDLGKILDYKKLLELFTGEELISWKKEMLPQFENLLRKGSASSPSTGIFDYDELGRKQWETFHDRVGEHNIRIIAKYYTRISFGRMAELLDFGVEKMEPFLCNLIVSGVIAETRVDRLNKIVDFRPRRPPIEILDQWQSHVGKLTDLLQRVTHQIGTEEMVHKHLHV